MPAATPPYNGAQPSRRVERLLVLGLIVFATANALLWSIARIPGSGGPDELGHFGLVQAISNQGGWPVFEGYAKGRFYGGPVRAQVAYELTPNLSAVPAAMLVYVFGSENVAFNYHLARLVNVALYPVTLTLGYLTLRRLYPGRPIMRLMPLTLMATVPQFTLIHSYVTNDSPAVAASTFAIYASVRAWQQGFRPRDVALLGVALGLVALHKFSGFMILPAAAVLVVAGLWRSPRRLFYTATALTLIVLAMSLWWYVRMWVLYGDPLGVATTQRAVDASGPSPLPYRQRGVGIVEFLLSTNWVSENFATFWAGYGKHKLKFPPPAYVVLAVLCGASLLGLAVRLVLWAGKRIPPSPTGLVIGWMALLFFGLLGLSLWSSYAIDFALHGRYLFPELLPFAVLFTFGLAAVPPLVRRTGAAALAAVPLLVAGNLAYTLAVLVPDVVGIPLVR